MIRWKDPTVSGEEWHLIELSDIGSFEVLLRPPSFSDVVVDSELGAGFTAYRIKACVRGWRGVQDEQGQEVLFTPSKFENLCLMHPRIIYQLGARLNVFYSGLTEETRKNSSAPPGDPSPPAADATPPETSNLNSRTSEPSPPGVT